MAPPKRTATATKRAHSSDAVDEPVSKHTRHSGTKTVQEEEPADSNSDQPQDTHIKSVQPNDAEQIEESSSKSEATAKHSARSDQSPEIKSEEKIKEESDDKSKPVEDGEPKVIEKGHVFFFYRPKMDVDKPAGTDDLQKLYMLLSPDAEAAAGKGATGARASGRSKSSRGSKPHHRLLILPQKILPSPGKGPKSRVWAFVDEASTDLKKLENRLERYTYETKTRGTRTQEPARLVGEARYDIILVNDQAHFVYELEVPEQPCEVQDAFNILKSGQFLMAVKNPEIQTPATERGQARYATLGKSAAKLPKHLQDKFHGIRKEWVRHTALDSPEFLDVQHVEVVLIAVHKGAKEEFAQAVKDLEAEVKEEEENEIDREENPEDHAFKELKVDEETIPAAIEEFK
ncbi:hypothetical protein BGZ99_010425 [Dissophora globulifera]|uniref:Uncharacterized protein n=1 Tax=Dissophora globulifera TaxID=979702 RepID=A0A9P6RRR5_9FUNG|nr:hypothetical protein BGZ99_010425 [Dissophora globulifera]